MYLMYRYRDWPTCFGCDRCGHFAGLHGYTVPVVNREGLLPREEVVEDPMPMIHTFSGRRYGLHRYRKRIREAADGR